MGDTLRRIKGWAERMGGPPCSWPCRAGQVIPRRLILLVIWASATHRETHVWLLYALVLAVLGFLIGNQAHFSLGLALAAGGVYAGWKIGAAGNAVRARMAAQAKAAAIDCPTHIAADNALPLCQYDVRHLPSMN